MYFNMILRAIYLSIFMLSIIADVQCQGYQYIPLVKGWLAVHKVRANWDKAYQQCKDEGAVLAAPLTEELAYGMKSVMGDNKQSIQYFIDMKARFVPGVFVSSKSILLEDLPVEDMITSLDARLGNCTSIDRDTINVVSCDTPLPYICYREQHEDETLTECGTYDKEYKLEKSTGSCYKLHEESLTWDQAYSTCMAEGGHLAVLNDANEAKVVEKLAYVNDTYSDYVLRQISTYSHVVYIGIRAFTGKLNWISVLGDSVKDIYNTWSTMSNDRELCGGLMRNYDYSGQLSTINCTDDRPFVCEKNPNTIIFRLPSKN